MRLHPAARQRCTLPSRGNLLVCMVPTVIQRHMKLRTDLAAQSHRGG